MTDVTAKENFITILSSPFPLLQLKTQSYSQTVPKASCQEASLCPGVRVQSRDVEKYDIILNSGKITSQNRPLKEWFEPTTKKFSTPQATIAPRW